MFATTPSPNRYPESFDDYLYEYIEKQKAEIQDKLIIHYASNNLLSAEKVDRFIKKQLQQLQTIPARRGGSLISNFSADLNKTRDEIIQKSATIIKRIIIILLPLAFTNKISKEICDEYLKHPLIKDWCFAKNILVGFYARTIITASSHQPLLDAATHIMQAHTFTLDKESYSDRDDIIQIVSKTKCDIAEALQNKPELPLEARETIIDTLLCCHSAGYKPDNLIVNFYINNITFIQRLIDLKMLPDKIALKIFTKVYQFLLKNFIYSHVNLDKWIPLLQLLVTQSQYLPQAIKFITRELKHRSQSQTLYEIEILYKINFWTYEQAKKYFVSYINSITNHPDQESTENPETSGKILFDSHDSKLQYMYLTALFKYDYDMAFDYWRTEYVSIKDSYDYELFPKKIHTLIEMLIHHYHDRDDILQYIADCMLARIINLYNAYHQEHTLSEDFINHIKDITFLLKKIPIAIFQDLKNYKILESITKETIKLAKNITEHFSFTENRCIERCHLNLETLLIIGISNESLLDVLNLIKTFQNELLAHQLISIILNHMDRITDNQSCLQLIINHFFDVIVTHLHAANTPDICIQILKKCIDISISAYFNVINHLLNKMIRAGWDIPEALTCQLRVCCFKAFDSYMPMFSLLITRDMAAADNDDLEDVHDSLYECHPAAIKRLLESDFQKAIQTLAVRACGNPSHSLYEICLLINIKPILNSDILCIFTRLFKDFNNPKFSLHFEKIKQATLKLMGLFPLKEQQTIINHILKSNIMTNRHPSRLLMSEIELSHQSYQQIANYFSENQYINHDVPNIIFSYVRR